MKRNALCGASADNPTDSSSGFVFQIPPDKSFLDYYELGAEIGHGSFGSVYACTPAKAKQNVSKHSWLSRLWSRMTSSESQSNRPAPESGDFIFPSVDKLACKTLLKSRVESLGWLQKFGEKGLSAALVNWHPNVVRYLQFLEDSSTMYVVMERYSGSDLFDYVISNRPLSESEAAGILRQILHAVSYVHSLRCIHRDIKTENFVFEKQGGKLKLVDFGSCCWDEEGIDKIPSFQDSEINCESTNDSSVLPIRRRSIVGTSGYCA